VKQDNIAIARFKTTNLICMETFEAFPPMGRFTLRDEGKISYFLCYIFIPFFNWFAKLKTETPNLRGLLIFLSPI